MRSKDRRIFASAPNAIKAASLGLLFLVNSFTICAEGFKQRVSFAISGGASKGACDAGLNGAILYVLRYGEDQSGQEKVLEGGFRPFEAARTTGIGRCD